VKFDAYLFFVDPSLPGLLFVYLLFLALVFPKFELFGEQRTEAEAWYGPSILFLHFQTPSHFLFIHVFTAASSRKSPIKAKHVC
jgi:hypothetical protein